jgi:uncharacterized protein (DUF608 family)
MAQQAPFLYEGDTTREISFPLGGIGTGSIGLSGAGRLIDWEIWNRPNKGSTNGISHFAVRAERDGKVLDARVLNGPYLGNLTGDHTGDYSRNYGHGARRDSLAGIPHFKSCRFDGGFPVARLAFADERFPGEVALTAFNPFIPLNDADSSIPAALFAIELHNVSDAPIDYTVVGVLGHGPTPHARATPLKKGGFAGIEIATPDEIEADAPEYAELAVATDARDASRQSYLYRGMWFDALEVYWKDLNQPGRFKERTFPAAERAGGMRRDRECSLQAAHVTLAPGERRTVRFVISWYVPNFTKYWISASWHFQHPSAATGTWKNWYASQWRSAADVASYVLGAWDRLAAETLLFRDALYASDLPLPVLDAAAANLSTLKTATTVRLTDGTFYGWEGLHPQAGSCEGSCTHVWNYQQAVPFLFPALERSMREADYTQNMNEAGGLSFRMSLPIGSGLFTERPCADGQFGDAMKAYRDWKLCGDDAWLARLWPRIKRSIEFAWHPDNPDKWDPKKTGVLWGRQHHTLDMELYGPNSWLTGFYLGALKAGAEMADAVGEKDTAKEWRAMAERGRRWVDDNLFNGEFYVQKLDLADRAQLKPYASSLLSRRLMGADVYGQYWSEEHGELKYQLGDGCLIDQVLGQWHANLYGLGAIFDEAKTTTALRAIYRHNFKERLGDTFNPCRLFGLDDEAGTIIVAWPAGTHKPAVPAPYAQETFHGMEYAFGGALIQYGLLHEGVRVFRAVRERYSGANRNPWNEIECGSNYARSMAAWCGLLTLSGFSFDARRSHLGFAPRVRAGLGFTCFWSCGSGWGTATLENGAFTLRLLYGTLRLGSLGLPLGKAAATVALNGAALPADTADGAVVFKPVTMKPGDALLVGSAALTTANLPEVAGL